MASPRSSAYVTTLPALLQNHWRAVSAIAAGAEDLRRSTRIARSSSSCQLMSFYLPSISFVTKPGLARQSSSLAIYRLPSSRVASLAETQDAKQPRALEIAPKRGCDV